MLPALIDHQKLKKISTRSKAFFITQNGSFVDMKLNCTETIILYSVGAKFYELCYCNVTNTIVAIKVVELETAASEYVNFKLNISRF